MTKYEFLIPNEVLRELENAYWDGEVSYWLDLSSYFCPDNSKELVSAVLSYRELCDSRAVFDMSQAHGVFGDINIINYMFFIPYQAIIKPELLNIDECNFHFEVTNDCGTVLHITTLD